MDTSEDVPPGVAPPTPLPVPALPVGGGRLGECGLIVPDGGPPLPPDISAGAWVVADMTTGEVLAAKDPHGRYRPASTLKLLTAQVMLRNLTNLDQVVAGTENDAGQEGTRVGIEAGGQYTVRQLITYLVIISGNDAANALARTNGGYDKTVADMNAAAQAMGALDTRAVTPSGLDGPGQSTSAYDLALFARGAMATPTFPGDRVRRWTSGCPRRRARDTSPRTTTSCCTSTPARSAARRASPTTPATPSSGWPSATAAGWSSR